MKSSHLFYQNVATRFAKNVLNKLGKIKAIYHVQFVEDKIGMLDISIIY